jgi:hypothetical protein
MLIRLRLALLPALLLCLAPAAAAQPADVIDKLLDFAKEKKKIEPKDGDGDLRKLQVQRYNVALEELAQRGEDYKKNLTNQQTVFDAARHLVEAELEVQAKPEDRAKVLEKVVELVKWYEDKLERSLKEDVGSRAELLRARYTRLTYEIDLLKTRREMKAPK